MAIIAQYNIVDLIDGATAIAAATQFDSGEPFSPAFGLTHDTDDKLYHIIYGDGQGFDKINRTSADISTIELSIFPAVSPDNFLNATFATIINVAPPAPAPAIPKTFGNVIW